MFNITFKNGGATMKNLLSTIKNDFPDKAIDISDSLQLLKEMINSTMEDINNKMNKAFADRDFDTMGKYSDLAKQAYDYENKLEEIIDFLDIDYDEIETVNEMDNTDKAIEKSVLNYEEYRVNSNIEHSLNENFTHIRPYGFKFLSDELIQVKTWKEMFVKTSGILIDIDEENFLNFENIPKMNGKKRKYFSKEKNNIREPIEINGKIYIETNMSSNGIRNIIVKMLKNYGYGIKDYKVYFMADYTEINN